MSTTIRVAILGIIVFILVGLGAFYLYRRVSNNDSLLQTDSSPIPTPLVGFNTSPKPTTTASSSPRTQANANNPLSQPSTGEDISSTLGITLRSPQGAEKITSPVKIVGSANVFEGHVSISIKDSTGRVIGQGYATGCMGDIQCPFETTISFETPQTETGSIEAFSQSPRDGQAQFLQTTVIRF